MTDTVSAGAEAEAAGRRDALAERLFQSLIGSMELASIWAGLRLDLYEVLRRHGPVTVDELAELAGIDTRYAREWLEQQAVAGLLDVEGPGQDAASRRYRLPDAHADVLLDADHPAHAGATAWWMGSLAEAQRLAEAAGVADRVRFRVVDAAELSAAGEGGYDAAFIFEALHDMARPPRPWPRSASCLAPAGS